MAREQSLDIGTVVKIVDILKDEAMRNVLHLRVGMEGIVQYHNRVFEMDQDSLSLQKGPNDEQMYEFHLPSGFRIGPIMKMPDTHKVIVWIVKGQMYQVTNLNILYNESLKWYVVRTGEVLDFGSSQIVQ